MQAPSSFMARRLYLDSTLFPPPQLSIFDGNSAQYRHDCDIGAVQHAGRTPSSCRIQMPK